MPNDTALPLRGIRSDRMRDLARDAMRQGFALVQNGSGHPVLVSPEGERVGFSSTKRDNYHATANVRAALVRAGFDPSGTSGRTRPPRSQYPAGYGTGYAGGAPRQETPPMTEQEAPTTPEPEATAEAVLNHPGGQSAGGKYAVVAAETVDLNGTPLRIRTRADGQLWGWIADPRVKGGRRAFVSTKGDRAEVIARATEVVEGRGPAPKVVRRRKASGAATPTNPETPATTPETAPSDPEPVIGDRHAPEPTERRNGGPRPSGGVWAAAYVDPADYPVARALDELDRLVVPAIEALRAAGKADAAELVKAELGRTPAEEELLRLYQEVMSRPRLGG